MSESSKTEEFLQKLTPCIERGELEACVEEAARVAKEMGGEVFRCRFAWFSLIKQYYL